MVVNTVHHRCDVIVIMSNGILKKVLLFEGKDLLAYQVEFCQVFFTNQNIFSFLFKQIP